MEATTERRRGGRQARRELRARPLDEALKPVRPGLCGGAYRPLSDEQVRQVHEAALTVLEEIGLANAIPSCIERVVAAGGVLDGQGRLLFPRALIEGTLEIAARRFRVCARDPAHDLEPWGKNVHFGTAGAAVHMVDPMTREIRESRLADLYDAARLVDRLEHVHFFQRPLVPRDLVEPLEVDLNTLFACLSGTGKHVGTSFTEPEHVVQGLSMLHEIAGSESAWRERPFVSMSCCFVVPPLRFAEDACRCLEVAVEGGMPVLLLAAGQAGATSPASLAGAVVQEVAEVLAGLAYVNLIKPGHPAIFGPWPFVSDLRTGAMSGGSAEQALLMSACAQMAHFYDLPGGVASGMSDSKLPDAQAGHEVGLNHALVGNAGANMIYESAGMRASLLAYSLEGAVIDNDAIGAALRTIRGHRDRSRRALSVAMSSRDVCRNGPGHLSGARANTQPDAERLSLSRDRRPHEPQGMGRAGIHRQSRPWAKLSGSSRCSPPTSRPISGTGARPTHSRARFPIQLPPSNA